MLDDELELTAALVERYLGPQQHLLAIARRVLNSLVAIAKHGAADLRPVVLEGEIPVAGARPGEIAELSLDPDKVVVALQHALHLPI